MDTKLNKTHMEDITPKTDERTHSQDITSELASEVRHTIARMMDERSRKLTEGFLAEGEEEKIEFYLDNYEDEIAILNDSVNLIELGDWEEAGMEVPEGYFLLFKSITGQETVHFLKVLSNDLKSKITRLIHEDEEILQKIGVEVDDLNYTYEYSLQKPESN